MDAALPASVVDGPRGLAVSLAKPVEKVISSGAHPTIF